MKGVGTPVFIGTHEEIVPGEFGEQLRHPFVLTDPGDER
jgi:hypothetical protein